MLRKLSDFITIKHGFAFKGEDISGIDNGVMLVTPGNFAIGGGFQKHKCKFFVGKYPEEYVLNPRDLIVTMTDLSKEGDTLGYGALVPGDGYIYLHNQRIGLVEIHKEGLNKEYLYWFMRSRNYQRAVVSSCSGSVIKHTSPARITNIEIDLPELSTQTRIASILSALEFKIELNTAINNNLEQQAQALLTNFLDSDSIPYKLLTDIAVIKYGKGLATKNLLDSGYPVFGGNGIIGYYTDYLYAEPQILVSCRGAASGNILESLPYSYVTSNSLVVELADRRYYEIIKRFLMLHPLHSYATGSAQPQITIDNLKNVTVPYPEMDKLNTITPVFESFAQKTLQIHIENERLAAIRDALLPKLMSGEIDVSKVDISDPGCLDKSLFNKETE